MNLLDRMLNKLTMYMVVLYALITIGSAAGILALFGRLGYSVTSLALSLGVIGASGLAAHYLLKWAFGAATGSESWRISILILFLILRPSDSLAGLSILALASVLAVASKYVLARNARHIFNPAAIALVILGLLGSGEIFWWVGSQALLPVVAVAGFLVVRKQRRFQMVFTFLAVALVTSYLSASGNGDIANLMKGLVLSGPLIFFAGIMLTEPYTMPPTRKTQLIYASITGLLYGLHFAIGPLRSSPELALVLGNCYAYAVSYRQRLRLEFKARRKVSPGVYEFAFVPDRPLRFQAGQYLEWTMPIPRADLRGNRRYLTIASSPTEQELLITTRVPSGRSSAFKQSLLALKPGATVWAGQLGGDFTLPPDSKDPVVWIAGGIGITPFRSMARQLIDSGRQLDATLFYSSSKAGDFAYSEIFKRARANGLTTKYLLTGNDIPEGWNGLTGKLSADHIRRQVAQPTKASYYLSGPPAMVDSYKQLLRDMGVSSRRIRTDYFPGL